MKLRIPIVPVAVLAMLGAGAVVFAVTRPDPPPPPRPSLLDHLDEGEQQLVQGALVGLLMMGVEPATVDLAFGNDVSVEARYSLNDPPKGFRDDCSGFVSGVMTQVGVPMDGTVASIYDLAVVHDQLHWREVPLVGDLIVWDNTTDRNGNGEWDDPSTHIGVVIDVEDDGTAIFAHSGTSRGRVIGRMNLTRPDDRKDADGTVVNSVLRSYSRGDPQTAGYTAAELFSAFITVDPSKDWHSDPPPPESWP